VRRRSARVGITWKGVVGALAAAPVAVCATMALPTSAVGASPPIKVGEPGSKEKPSIAVDGAGTAYVVWPNTANSKAQKVDYCVVPTGMSTCSHSGALTPGPGGAEPFIGQAQVLIDGATVVVLAEVFNLKEENEPVQEWTSTDGGATFKEVDGLKSVAAGIESADTEPVNAVVMPGNEALGYAFVTAGEKPSFDEFPFLAPPECSFAKCPKDEEFAELQLTGPDLSNEPGMVASKQGANAGVLGVFETLGAPGPSGCTFGSAFYYGTGSQETNNSYDIEPGQPKSAWRKALSAGDCEVGELAVGAGPSGFGVVEENELTKTTVYHPFDASSQEFDTPTTTIAAEGESQPSASQDGSGGIYVTFLSSNGIRLAFSSNGGAGWTGPNTINANSDGGANDLSSSVGADGHGWATWIDGGSVFVQPFVASDAIPPAPPAPPTPESVLAPAATAITTVQSGAGISGASLTVPRGTSVTDQAHIAGIHAAIATGIVSYALYKDSKCTKPQGTASSAGVVTGLPGHSAAVKLGVGGYYWRATYSGDAANAPSTSACGSEVLTVATEDKNLGLPSTKICLSRRKFVVHPRAPKGVKLVSVEVQINGKLKKRGKLSKRATTVSLVGLPKGTFRVALITKSSKGKIYEDIRTFHTCVPGKHKHKK
jgi:hypothetical protein